MALAFWRWSLALAIILPFTVTTLWRARAALRRDHEGYVAERWSLLDATEREEVRAAGLAEVFEKRGIGGLGNWQSVKCLHLHFAHHLARENAIGALLADEYGLRPCTAGPQLG